MPRVCTVCTHAARNAIDPALDEATPKQQIAMLRARGSLELEQRE